MKRIVIITGILLLMIAGMIWAIYTVRKSNINEQYVSKNSGSILSFAIDDLLLDNVYSLLSWNKNSKGAKQEESWIKKIIFDAGISIPARIYLFSIGAQKTQFYGILPVHNYDDCFSFFAEHFPDGISIINKENGTVSVDVNKHIKLIFNQHHFIYQLTPEERPGFKTLQSLLLQPYTWTTVASFKGYEHSVSKKHISYSQKDKRLNLEATVSRHKTQIDGNYMLSQQLADTFQVRNIDTTNQTLTLWSLLPLHEVPVLSYFMRKYTGLNQEQLKDSYADYFDLNLKADYTIQRDSAVTYTYDADFNSIKEIQVNEFKVPDLVLSWKYNKALERALPNKMFYKFRKKQSDQYLLNTTSTLLPVQVQSINTQYPLYCFVDFETWPASWNVSLFKTLKEKKVKAKLWTTLQNKRTLRIKGQIFHP